MLDKEQQYKARKRANSETTEVPPTFDFGTIMEPFHVVDIHGIGFDTVKLLHPRPGTFPLKFYAALIPIFGSTSQIVVHEVVNYISLVSPLQLFIVTFEAIADFAVGRTGSGEVSAESRPDQTHRC